MTLPLQWTRKSKSIYLLPDNTLSSKTYDPPTIVPFVNTSFFRNIISKYTKTIAWYTLVYNYYNLTHYYSLFHYKMFLQKFCFDKSKILIKIPLLHKQNLYINHVSSLTFQYYFQLDIDHVVILQKINKKQDHINIIIFLLYY